MFFRAKNHEIICIGSTSKDIFFPVEDGLILSTPEDILSKEKIAFELGGKYRVRDLYEAVGGVAANIAHGLNRLGIRAACYSKIGDDETGRWVRKNFSSKGVPTDLLFIDKDAKTDLSAIIVLTQNGERTIFHNRDANERLEIYSDQLEHARWLFVSSLNGDWKNNLKKILTLKKDKGIALAINPGQHNIREDVELMMEAVSHSDILLLNKDEALELATAGYPDAAHEKLDDEVYLLNLLIGSGAKKIGMTDGKRGSWATDGTQYWRCPIRTRTEVLDTTGAGDAFGSGFFAAHLLGKPLEMSLRYGIANSGSVVGRYGATDGLLSKQNMETMIDMITPMKIEVV